METPRQISNHKSSQKNIYFDPCDTPSRSSYHDLCSFLTTYAAASENEIERDVPTTATLRAVKRSRPLRGGANQSGGADPEGFQALAR